MLAKLGRASLGLLLAACAQATPTAPPPTPTSAPVQVATRSVSPTQPATQRLSPSPAPTVTAPAPPSTPTKVEPPPTPTARPPTPTLTPTRANINAKNEQLIQAAESGDLAGIERLLRNGANINARDSRGRTPVMAATHGRRTEAVRALIAAGADINLQDNRQDNPFLYAGAEGLLDILKLTIAAGASTTLTNRFGGTALIPAAERGHVEVVKELLGRTNVDVNHVNHLGWTALLEAVILGSGGARHTEIVQMLVDAGANVNIPDKDGVSALSHARRRGFTAIVAILERAGAR